jgi:fibronectin-binding autotransporter adhesin
MKYNPRWFRPRDRTGKAGPKRGCPRRGASPEVVALEDRRMLSMLIEVTSTADSGPNTLRAAIGETNAATQPVEIDFQLGDAATITLTSGQLELNTAQPIAIVGPGADRLAVDGNGASRVFEIDTGVTVSISGMSVTGGFTTDTGAGLLNQGNLALTGVTVSHNTQTGFSFDQHGGGLVNLGVATVVGCTFADNTGVYGGGVTNGGMSTLHDCSFVDNTATFFGGGMYNYGSATLDGCSFVGNACGDDGGGFSGLGFGSLQSGSSELRNCSFIGNSANNSGGGLELEGTLSGPLQVVDCVFRENQAIGGGGGLVLAGTNSTPATVTGCRIEANRAMGPPSLGEGAAGGLGLSNTATTLSDCIVSNNYATGYSGGMVASGGALTMTGVTISGNTAGIQGGGLTIASPATLNDCTISGNSAGQGGGLLMFGRADAAFVACTISGNSANTPGGGGGLYSYPHYGTDPSVTLTDTIVAGNTASDGASDFAQNYVGPVTGSYNLIGTGGSGGLTAGDHNLLNVADPGLTPLGDYGGPTETMALLPGSPAIGAGTAVPGVTTDQRGFALDGPPDIGAFQSHSGALVVDAAIDGLGSPPGELSLRQAVNLADVLTGGATITFDRSTFAGPSVIALTAGPLELSNATGSITIQGPGLGRLAVSGSGVSRVFQVKEGSSASLAGLTITGGFTTGDGGGLLNQGSIALVDVVVVGNSAANGGGLANSGTALIVGSSIDGNAASADGGGIFNTGALVEFRSDLSANSAGTGGGGLYNSGTAALVFCTVDDNTAAAGGGVYADPSGQPVVLIGTDVKRNNGGNIFGRVIRL